MAVDDPENLREISAEMNGVKNRIMLKAYGMINNVSFVIMQRFCCSFALIVPQG